MGELLQSGMVLTGIYYSVSLAAAGYVLGTLTTSWAGLPFYILAAFCIWFFRDPEREIPAGPVAVSPADGKVVLIRKKPGDTKVSIFLNIFDVHVNRSPIAGKIIGADYRKGKFHVASKEAASIENEMNTLTVEGEGSIVTFSQIAGLIARRIVSYKQQGDFVTRGERIGLIKFGSRMDVSFGDEWEIVVREGQRVAAGSSILARKRDA
jgi:phosphatidylserine decarboxylase